MIDEDAKALLLKRRELAKQMLEVEPGSAEESSLFEEEAAVVAQIKAAGVDLADPMVAYGIAYGVLASKALNWDEIEQAESEATGGFAQPTAPAPPPTPPPREPSPQ